MRIILYTERENDIVKEENDKIVKNIDRIEYPIILFLKVYLPSHALSGVQNRSRDYDTYFKIILSTEKLDVFYINKMIIKPKWKTKVKVYLI